MERARSEWLRDLGWPIDKIVAHEKCLFVVRSLEMKFRRPARLGDALAVSTNIHSMKKASMRLAQKVSRDNDGADELLVEAVVELALVSSETFQPVRLPQFLTSIK